MSMALNASPPRGRLAALASAFRTRGPVLRALAYYASVLAPRAVLWGLPPVFGTIFWALLPEQRAGVRANLRRIRGRQALLRERRDEIKTFIAFARSLAEGFATLGPRAGAARVEVKGAEIFERIRAEGKGCILVTAHTSGLEAAGATLRQAVGLDVVMAMRAETDHAARAISDASRVRGGLRVVHVGADPLAALSLAEQLRRGGAVGLQIDRMPDDVRGLPVTLFGQQTAVPLGPFLLARASGAPVVPVFTRRTGFLRVSVLVGEPIHVARGSSRDEMASVAERVVRELEQWVDAAPTEWLDWGEGRAR